VRSGFGPHASNSARCRIIGCIRGRLHSFFLGRRGAGASLENVS
jgi:hypothetical protein